MKKGFLLSILLILGCGGGDDSNIPNDNLLNKKIKSMTVISAECASPSESVWFYFDENGVLDYTQHQQINPFCDTVYTQSEEIVNLSTVFYEFFDDIIVATHNDDTIEVPINGYLDGVTLDNNGYPISQQIDCNRVAHYVWQNGNLVQRYYEEPNSYPNGCEPSLYFINYESNYEYSDQLRPYYFLNEFVGTFWRVPSAVMFLENHQLKGSTNLISTIQELDRITNYNYQFDSEGYPTVVTADINYLSSHASGGGSGYMLMEYEWYDY
jgi:hypothetical protein|tara:strand:- start:212 stop:1015 length:804 start_codon:yes stop_codon:yes gene_type:complete